LFFFWFGGLVRTKSDTWDFLPPEILFVEQLYYLWSAFLAKTSAKQGQKGRLGVESLVKRPFGPFLFRERIELRVWNTTKRRAQVYFYFYGVSAENVFST